MHHLLALEPYYLKSGDQFNSLTKSLALQSNVGCIREEVLCYYSCIKWESYLLHKNFILYTNNEALQFINLQKKKLLKLHA